MNEKIKVTIHVQRLMDLEEILTKIRILKKENPHVVFHIEVNY